MNSLQNLYFPICALFISMLVVITYFGTKRMNSEETKIYGKLIIVNVLESFIACTIVIIALTINSYYLLEILDKIDYLLILMWIWLLFSYSFSLISRKNKIINISFLINIFICILILVTKIEIINENGIMDSTGLSNYILTISVAFYIILLIICVSIGIIKNKNNWKKYVPMVILVILIIGMFIIRMIRPEIVLLSLIISFVDLIMYHTIENPDLKMLEEFHKQREIAEESNNEKISFLFNLSNDIKEPIMNIGTLCSAALNEENSELIKEDLKQIKSSSNELLSLVDNVLDVSELEKRKIGIRGRKYNVYNLFSTINKSFINELDKNIEYRFNYDNSIPEYLYGDSLRLKQIMNILLDNARDYTKEGFIELNVNHIIKYDVCRLIITVEDSGMGIESEELKHLFDKEKIYSDESLKTIDDAKENLGVLKSLVNLMNGTVMVNSEYGKGSRFTITIDQKIKEEKTKVIEAVEKYEELYENKEKVLLVTDEEDIQKEMKKLLKKYDIKLEIVKGGQDCLEKIRNKEKYDMILMEEELPKLSSEDTLIKLNELGIYKTPIIVLTARKEFGVEEELIKKGFSDVIKLPIKKEEIKKVMNKYFEK